MKSLRQHRRLSVIYTAGNGGSLATASHICNDLSKACRVHNRAGFNAICLGDSTAIITCLSNDFCYEDFYKIQVETKIKSGEIGKYSTYNVALFMLKVSKYIPENVLLQSIKSDANRHVTIVAYSTSHAELGYLVSQLKLEGILEPSSVQTTAVVHDKVITVTIGGDLP